MLQAYEGYLEKGRFIPIGPPVDIEGRRRVIVTVLDEPDQTEIIKKRLAALDEFFAAIEGSDEEVPEFERINFTREVEL